MKISSKTLISILCINIILLLSVVTVLKEENKNIRDLQVVQNEDNASEPDLLYIPKLNIKKSIKPGLYDFQQKQWNISSSYPHYATVSAKPNTLGGNTVIYAHNSENLFEKINQLDYKDKVILTNKDGKIFTYEYDREEFVLPSDVSVITREGRPRLTLLTCAGKKNSLRKLVHFKLMN